MIKISFDEPNNDDWREWREDCNNATVELIRSVNDGDSPTITDLYKDRRVRFLYKDEDGLFKGRCVYCEANVVGYQPGDIEHFRPKNRVRDENNKLITRDGADNEAVNHPGYYWLAYDWRNLLLACKRCNSYYEHKDGEKIGKGERFPVRAFRAFGPSEESFEGPLLLNPVNKDDPKNHLEYDVENGKLKALSDEGEMCNLIFGLNNREQLVRDRFEAFENTRQELIRCNKENDKEGLKKIITDIIEGNKSFTLARRAALKKYVIEYL